MWGWERALTCMTRQDPADGKAKGSTLPSPLLTRVSPPTSPAVSDSITMATKG